MPYQSIETALDTEHSIGTIWLNRPEKRNALDRTLVEELRDAAIHMEQDNAVRVVVIAGRGPAFCAGADLEYLRHISRFTVEENMEDSAALATTLRTISELAKPTIARVHGPAIAGGCGLATVCDIVIASTAASFGYTEVRIGFIPAIVMAFLQRKATAIRTRELLLSGRIIPATEAYAAGLVTTVVDENPTAGISEDGRRDHSRLDEAVNSIATDIARASPSAVRLTKQMLNALDGMSLDASLDYASRMNALARMTPDCKAGIAAFLERPRSKSPNTP